MNPVLARLVKLAQSALRAESPEKAGALIVNQIHTLVKVDRAVVVPLRGKRRILCISGDLEPSEDNPFSQAVQEARSAFGGEAEPRVLSPDDMPPEVSLPHLGKALDAMGGTRLLWLPLPTPEGGDREYALWLERWNRKSWSPEEIRMLRHAEIFFGHALSRRRRTRKRSSRRNAILLLAVLAAAMLLPVYARVTAPVQVVPDRPEYVFAPFDGIMEELAVEPGEPVREGDLIYRYDTRVLEQRLEEARRSVMTARAELGRLEGAAYADQEARARIPVQKLEVERKQAEVAFIQMQLELSEVRAQSDGVVVLDDPDALIGASLQTGQMVLRIADPDRTKLHVMVPVSDAGLLEPRASVQVRLDSDPLRAVPARVERVGFDVNLSDERVPSVLVEARWTESPDVAPGQRGSARIRGPKVPLGIQIFRKPLMAVRRVFGI